MVTTASHILQPVREVCPHGGAGTRTGGAGTRACGHVHAVMPAPPPGAEPAPRTLTFLHRDGRLLLPKPQQDEEEHEGDEDLEGQDPLERAGGGRPSAWGDGRPPRRPARGPQVDPGPPFRGLLKGQESECPRRAQARITPPPPRPAPAATLKANRVKAASLWPTLTHACAQLAFPPARGEAWLGPEPPEDVLRGLAAPSPRGSGTSFCPGPSSSAWVPALGLAQCF